MKTRFEVYGQLDRAARSKGTVEIDRKTGIFSVRPFRSGRVYSITLSAVAEIIVQRMIVMEAGIKKVSKRKKAGG